MDNTQRMALLQRLARLIGTLDIKEFDAYFDEVVGHANRLCAKYGKRAARSHISFHVAAGSSVRLPLDPNWPVDFEGEDAIIPILARWARKANPGMTERILRRLEKS